jgi:hypothetical protein
MWLYFSTEVATTVFGATDTSDPRYQEGVEWAGLCFGAYSAVTFLYSLVLPRLATRVGPRLTHAMSLTAGDHAPSGRVVSERVARPQGGLSPFPRAAAASSFPGAESGRLPVPSAGSGAS